jgi:hypothetical protein
MWGDPIGRLRPLILRLSDLDRSIRIFDNFVLAVHRGGPRGAIEHRSESLLRPCPAFGFIYPGFKQARRGNITVALAGLCRRRKKKAS